MTEFDVFTIVKDLIRHAEKDHSCVERFYDYGDFYEEVKEEFFKILKTALDIPLEA